MKPSNTGYILIIDDNRDICDLLAHLLEHAGYKTQQGYDGSMAINLLSQCEPDLLLLDSVIPEPNGMAVLAKAHSMYPQLPVIIITGTAGILSAVCAIKAGAWDYLPKPFDNNRVLELVNRAVQTRGTKNDINSHLNRDISARISELMGKSPETQQIIKDIVRVAHTDFSVIIQGETGTGKEMIARNIHLSSKRATANFIPIDCGAMSDSLIENELFGHEKGSFTGADQSSIGKFEAANGGTLFLDEIANMSLSSQSKLLRVLQEHVIYRIGGVKAIPVNVRILVASNEYLLDGVVKGRFREDLYYRLNEYVIHIKPLRERPEDILFLANRFMKEVCTELSIDLLTFSSEVKKILLNYPWTGNVRELRAVIRRVALISHEEVAVEDLNFLFAHQYTRPTNIDSNSIVADKERLKLKENYIARSCLKCISQDDYSGLSLTEINRINSAKTDQFIIQSVLKETGNNKAEAARRLKIDYKSLCSKLKNIITPEGK
jgi:two-component system nitrogen regulation response regulator GlnG